MAPIRIPLLSTHRLMMKRLRSAPLALVLGLGLIVSSLPAAPSAVAAPQTFTVNTTADSNGACEPAPGDCSLREAITAANGNGNGQDHDRIVFDIPGQGVQTIRPASPLPPISSDLVIDGYTQPGARPNTAAEGTNADLRIELDGGQMVTFGLRHAAGANSRIQGLVINNFSLAGIQAPEQATVAVTGNFIGTDATGTVARPNLIAGVILEGDNVFVGGETLADRNLVSANGIGVSLAGNAGVENNLIGTDRTGRKPLGNQRAGLFLRGTGAFVAANTIAFNGADGITIKSLFPGDLIRRNQITRNAIFANSDLGIDVNDDGPTPNDPKDGDVGPSDLQNFPDLTAAVSEGGKTTITGALNSVPNKTYTIELFSNPDNGDIEARSFIGEETVTTDDNGDAPLSVTVDRNLGGHAITATARNNAGRETSEVSAPVIVTGQQAPPPPPGDQPTPPGDQPPPPDQGQQGVPLLTSAVSPQGKKGKKAKKTVISGSLSSQPNRAYVIAFFGPGQSPLGEDSITTNGNGQASFSHTVTQRLAGQAITATATDTTTGETSERSSPITVKQQKGKKGKKGKGSKTKTARSVSSELASAESKGSRSEKAKQGSGKHDGPSKKQGGKKDHGKKHDARTSKKHDRQSGGKQDGRDRRHR